MSSHHHLILFHLNVLNHHISSLHFFSAHSSSVTSLFFPSICSLPPTCFRATLSSSSFLRVILMSALGGVLPTKAEVFFSFSSVRAAASRHRDWGERSAGPLMSGCGPLELMQTVQSAGENGWP